MAVQDSLGASPAVHHWSSLISPLSQPFTGDVLKVSTTPNNMTTTVTPAVTGPLTGTSFPTSTNGSVMPFPAIITQPPCQWILYQDIPNTRVRIWDLIILIPNLLFLLFLLWKVKIAIAKLRNSNSPIFTAFYGLVFLVSIISVLRCVVSMTVNASILAGDIADKVLWLILRFFLLGTELSVVIFGLAFGHLDSRTSIQRVLLLTSFIALIYSCTQGTLEFTSPDPNFQAPSKTNNATNQDYDIFGHGGMIFLFSSSLFFFVVYTIIYVLPWTQLREKLSLPSKKSFYYYSAFLALLNVTQAVGSALLYYSIMKGMCVVDVTTYLYFTCFDPLVYFTFLREFFRITQPSILFSYKHQVDEVPEEDTSAVSMPYQASLTKADDLSISSSFDSTHFDRHAIQNLNGSIQASEEDMEENRQRNGDYYQVSA